MKAVNIDWDVDSEEELACLPTEINIPTNLRDVEEISDYLSDVTGYCHKGFHLAEREQASLDSLIESAACRKTELVFGTKTTTLDSKMR